MQEPTLTELRRGALAVSVLHDLDVEPAPLGVTLTGPPAVWVSWGEFREALRGEDPESHTGRLRLAGWLQARRWAADAGRALLAASLRPVGLPVDHAVHLGPGWVQEQVLGGALDLGLGAVGIDPDDVGRVVLLPPPALAAAGLDPAQVWPRVRARLEEIGALAGERARSDPKGQLRPFRDADAVTLLGSRALREVLADDGDGLVAAAVPMRRLGWIKMALIDPAFAPAAAAASLAVDRGFTRPLLLTADEVTLVPEGGSPQRLALLDAAVPTPRHLR